jgi:hypothetical protein
MPRTASGKMKLPFNGRSRVARIVVPNEFRCESWAGETKVPHPTGHRCTALLDCEPETTFNDGVIVRPIDCCIGSGGYYTVYPRGRGAAAGSAPSGYASVSRWVSPEEAGAWLRNFGTAIPSRVGGDRLYVVLPGSRQPGGTGPVRIDFAVPETALIQTGKVEWRMILQPIQSTPIHNVIMTVPNGITLPNDK